MDFNDDRMWVWFSREYNRLWEVVLVSDDNEG